MAPGEDAPLPRAPSPDAVRSISRSDDAPDEPGTVVWHRDDLRIADNPALAAAAADADRILPLFVFDPGFYDERGAACDARIEFLHDCLRDLDRQYRDVGGAGLTYGHGDPLDVLARFVDAGWEVVASATASGRYGRRRDERARERLGVRFVAGDGLVRDADRPREDWSDRVESWFAADPFDWDPRSVAVERVETGVDPDRVSDAYGVAPTKTRVPTGGRGPAKDRLRAFAERIAEYPGSISSPVDAREGTSGLSAYLRFGCLSVREVHRHVDERAPDGRGKSMYVSRLFWNRHYTQKLLDWPGWLDRAVNPVYEGFNGHRHDPDLVAVWKRGETGFPMVDASMRCLRETGWLNFRMRALCASFYFHILQQPWRIGADHFYEHLIDGDPAINYTQWQSQCGLVGRPGLRLYDPRKQVRDQDPDGEFVGRWVPELDPLPAAHLDAPEKTPLAVQREVGIEIGEAYPYPVVDYEAAREEFRERYGAVHGAAAARLGDEEIARRASLSGGVGAARSIAADHGEPAEPNGDDADATSQTGLDEFG
ncbi:cryptochrome/deoxyribodipyrimidine photo-lyase family protein [Halorubrum ezzemoulense]|uniref:Deoxyribodipyrimidine photo-lyase/cryptochrome family protein n=1 Tax=Halorubrum ezzemoulense TaxID=337243 RepID=A0A256KBP0_HALEZ|nr:cryptochrome/deoxyribodipyrimidine photo-lyase family protein [Halorubrum ezzemoulense]OYR78555.1 deoxyribodipyrimidine photolyase [Halorubrum ezzemoulense]QAY20233.1 deoxyribodipyrimidine photo-lyase/cryptochrome family protein [Halorubrum ezzemoulense]